MGFDDMVNQCLGSCAVIHVQVHADTTRKCGQGLGNFGCPFIAGCGSNHYQTFLSQLQRNRRTDAARCARDQGHLTFKLGCTHANISFTSASEAGSNNGAPVSSLSIRLTNPASTLPGPHSTMCPTLRALMARTDSTHRTGPNDWR